MKKILKSMAMLSLGCFCLSASAIDTVDLGAIELGKVYSVPDMCAVTGTLTAPSTGTLLQDGVADINLEGLEKTWAGYGNNGQVYSYSVTEGQTYTASCDFVFSGGNVVWKMQGAEALAVVDVDPAEGSVISTSINGTGEIIIQFNAVVSVQGATLEANGKSAPLQVNGAGSVKAAVAVRPALAAFYADGTLNSAGNEAVKVTLTGVEDSDGNLYNGDGVLSLNYVSAPKALELVSTDFAGRHLKSYYAPNDPEGILTFTFDGDVLDNGTANLTISVGAPEVDGGYYYEVIRPEINGSVVKVDLTGKLRELNRFISMSELPYVALKLGNVRDLSGNLATGDSDATVGSYNFFFTYDYIEPVTISSEFVPANGASLSGVDKVEIWFNNADKISFDGVLFSCPAAKVVVPMQELELTREGTDMTIVVAVPAEVKGQKGVSVTLNNMVSLDGYDHTKQVKATYDAWVVTLVSPIQDDGTYATTGEDDFVFTVNEAYGYMRYDLYNGEDWVYGSWFNDKGDGTYTAFNNNWPLYQNMENRMLVRGYNEETEYWADNNSNVAECTFYFNGLTEGFSYSDVKFVSIEPEANSQIIPTDNFHFTVTFDGLVNITSQTCINTGMGSSVAFASIVPVDPEETSGLSSVWELYPSSSILKGTSLDISIYAYDINGKLVEGNMGGGETDYLQFSFSVYNSSNYKALNVYPADGANLVELSQIEISNPNYPTGVNYAYDKAMPFISDKLGNTVYTFSKDDFQVIEDPASSVREMTFVRATLQHPIQEEGSYMLFIPEGFFILGAEFETYLSQEVQVLYTIGSGSSTASLVVEPSEGQNLDELNYILINTAAQINTACEEYITLYSFNLWSDVDYWSQWSPASKFEKTAEGYKLNLDQTLTEDGEYSITIPAEFFILDGKPLEGAYITFTIGEGSSQGSEGTVELTLDPAPGSTVEELTKITIDAPGISDSMANWDLEITVTNQKGEIVRTVTGSELSEKSFDMNTWQFLGFALDFTENPIKENGTYTVNIPNGMFEFFDMSRSKAMTAQYTVGSTSVNDEWEVTLVSPIQNDGTYATTGEEDFVFSMTQSYGYMRYDLYNGEDWVYGSWLNDMGDGTYTAFNSNWPLFKDIENRMLVRGYDNEGDYWGGAKALAQVEFFFNGLTEGFTYSDVKFVSIDPENGAEISPVEGFHFTVTFDGLVSVTNQSCILQGFGMYSNFAKIVAVDPDQAGLSSVWELYPSLSDFNGTGMDISIYAYDADGKLVEGNVGGGENDYLQFSYIIYSTSLFRAVNVYPADGAVLEELTQVEVSNAQYPVGINYSYSGDMPFISDKLGNTVYTFTRDEFMVVEDPASSVAEMTFVKAVLRNAITAEGSYMLFIPEKFFMLGSQFETYYNEAVQAMYTIGGSGSAMLTIEPAEGANVDSLDYITITTDAVINTECEDYITLYSFSLWSDVDYWSQWSPSSKLEKTADGYKLKLDQTLTADGEYAISIPEGFFILDGKTNEWTSVTFTVGEGGSQNQEGTVELTLDPAPGTVPELSKISIDAPNIADSMANWDLNITVTDENGDVIRLVSGSELSEKSFDWNTWQFLGFYLDFTEDPITENGVYVVDIPNGMFEFFDMSRSKALTAVYTVDSTTGVSTILFETASRYEVYTINGVKVLSTTSAAELGKLQKGLYIINGKKVLVK